MGKSGLQFPSGDWEEFEKRLAARSKRRVIPFGIALTSTAAAAILLVFITKTAKYDAINTTIIHSGTINTRNDEEILASNPYPAEINVFPERMFQPSAVNIPDDNAEITEIAIEDSVILEELRNDSTAENVQPNNYTPSGIHQEGNNGAVLFDNGYPCVKNRSKHLIVSPYIRSFLNERSNITPVSSFKYSRTISHYVNNLFFFSGPFSFGAIPEYYREISEDHFTPIILGIDVNLPVGTGLGLTTGMDFSIFNSTFEGKGPYGMGEICQKACYIGIPLRLDWTVLDKGWYSAWFGAGIKADRLVYGRLGSVRLEDNSLNFSALCNAGIQFRLSRNAGVFIQPEISYYFKPENPPVLTYRTKNPVTFSLGAGLRFTL